RKQFRLPSDAFERLQHRRARQQRNRRIATAVLALALSAAATGTLFLAFRHETIAPRPAGVIDRSNVGRLRLLWTSPTGQAVGPPALALEAVVVGSERTGLYAFPASCLGKTTCAALWTTKVQNF